MTMTVRKIQLANDHDKEGALILRDGQLIAVLARLAEGHGARTGRWHIECGIGPLSHYSADFADLDSACDALELRMAS